LCESLEGFSRQSVPGSLFCSSKRLIWRGSVLFAAGTIAAVVL
jgi:hypothetical protein